ncbi:MAG: SurA N-terminal domain-containing protein [Acidobacteriota bacterium]
MLRTMRNDFKKYSWTLWLVIIAFLLGFSLTDIFSGGKANETMVAKVGETEIEAEAFQKQLFQTLENYKNQMKGKLDASLISQLRLPEQILNNLINSEVIRSEAKKLNLRSTKKELKEKIVGFPYFQRNGRFVGISEYKRILAVSRTNAKDFENNLENDIINDKLKELVTASLTIDKNTLKDSYRKEMDSADVEYIKLNTSDIKINSEINENELSEFYEKNKTKYKTSEKRKGNIIALKFDDFKKEINLEDIDMFNYFKEHKVDFQIPEKIKISRIFLKYEEADRDDILKRAEEIRKEITAGNFSDKAKLYSQDDKKLQGGDWGYFDWKNFTSQEQSIIGSLAEGEISDPVDTLSGFALLYVNEKSPERQEPYEKTKERIKNILEKEKLNEIVKNKLNKIYNSVKSSDDMKKSIKDKNLSVTELSFLTNGETIKGIDELGYISRKLFSMKEKEIQYPVEFIKGIAIVQLTSIKKSQIETFDNAKEKIKSDVVKMKKFEKAIKDSGIITNKLNSIKDQKEIEKFLENKKLKLEKFNYRRGNKLAGFEAPGNFDDKVFSMTENNFSLPLRLKNEAVILRVTKKKVTSETDFELGRDDYYKKKLKELKDNYFVSFILNKKKKYEIGINQALFDKIKDYVASRFN